jgi:SAM-dependent methyltransferase
MSQCGPSSVPAELEPAELLVEHLRLLTQSELPGPVLDLACGAGHNGVFLAVHGLRVVCCDRSPEALQCTGRLAAAQGARVELWQVDLERDSSNPLPTDRFGAILVFRYLHRPLIPCIRKALRPGGLIYYETFTTEQPRFGKPRNPDFLLKPGELFEWFKDWTIIAAFEGIKARPARAVAQLVCRKS